MKHLLQRIKDHTSRRNLAATVLARESASQRAELEDQAQTIGEMVIERDRLLDRIDDLEVRLARMMYERDRAERFLREAREANTEAAIDIMNLKALLEGQRLMIAARDTMLNEAEAENARLRGDIQVAIAPVHRQLLAAIGRPS